MISKIDNISLANEIIIARLKQNNPSFLPLDKYTFQCITGDQFDVLRTASGLEYDEFVRNCIDAVGEVHDRTTYAFTGYSIDLKDANKYVVYPYSRTNLYKDIYSDLLPSVFGVYFNLMKRINKIRQFGTGVGKALLIETSNFTKSEFDSLRLMEYKDVVELMVVVSEQIAKQNTDIQHLLEKVEELTTEKSLLTAEVERLNNLVISTSINTWR